MFDFLLGFSLIFLISLITFYFAIKYPEVSKIIIVALFIRVFVLLLGHYFVQLPDSSADAASILRSARLFAENGFLNLFDNYPGPGFRFIRWLIAIPFSIFGPSDLMAKSFSLFFGVGSVFLGWKLAAKLWNYQIAKKVGWTMALFPSLILYSALTMRSVYVCFFIIVALYGIVEWVKSRKFKSILLAITGFVVASFFHGPSIIGAFVFIGIVFLINIKELLKNLLNLKIKLYNLFFLIFIVYVFGLYLSNDIYIPYLKNFEFATDTNVLIRKARLSVSGVAAYPEWTIPKSSLELIYKIPIRAIYFIFAPFPWDIKETKHIIGMIDGMMYLFLTILIISNLKTIWNNFTLRIILLVLLAYIFIFAVGVGNFGTGIRHRSKFTFIFLFLAIPFIKNLIIKKK